MSVERSYNILALRGQNVDDMEVVQDYDLPESVAYTPEINDYMLSKVQQENYDLYIKNGMQEPEARTKAMANRLSAERNIKRLLKKMK